MVWVAIARYRRRGDLDKKHLFLTVPGAGSWRSGCQRGEVLARAASWLVGSCLLAVPFHGREKETISPAPSYENSIPEAPPRDLITSF